MSEGDKSGPWPDGDIGQNIRFTAFRYCDLDWTEGFGMQAESISFEGCRITAFGSHLTITPRDNQGPDYD